MKKFFSNLQAEQKSLPGDAAKLLSDHFWDLDNDELKKKEPKVWLTIEEACEILDYLSYLHLRGGRDSFLKELEKCNRNLYERIEQAENGHEAE